MSRMQNILEKAEREGSLHRVRTTTETVSGPALADAPMPLSPVRGPELRAESEPAIDPRMVRGTRFDPNLVSARAAGSVSAEQYPRHPHPSRPVPSRRGG